METYKYTIRSLMAEIHLTYENSYRLIERMRRKGLVKDFGLTKLGGKNAKTYGLTMLPKDFLEEERNKNQSPPPPPAFFSNPFNLKNAIDKRWRDDLY